MLATLWQQWHWLSAEESKLSEPLDDYRCASYLETILQKWFLQICMFLEILSFFDCVKCSRYISNIWLPLIIITAHWGSCGSYFSPFDRWGEGQSVEWFPQKKCFFFFCLNLVDSDHPFSPCSTLLERKRKQKKKIIQGKCFIRTIHSTNSGNSK